MESPPNFFRNSTLCSSIGLPDTLSIETGAKQHIWRLWNGAIVTAGSVKGGFEGRNEAVRRGMRTVKRIRQAYPDLRYRIDLPDLSRKWA